MAKCICTDTKHGHGNPCNNPTATENTKCQDCEKQIAKDETRLPK
jgi:hypothetical protein